MCYDRAHIAGLEPGTQIRLRSIVSVSIVSVSDDGRSAMINPATD